MYVHSVSLCNHLFDVCCIGMINTHRRKQMDRQTDRHTTKENLSITHGHTLLFAHKHTRGCTHKTTTHTHTNTHTNDHTHIHTRKQPQTHTPINTHIHKYAHTNKHTHARKHTHMYTIISPQHSTQRGQVETYPKLKLTPSWS